LVAVATFLLFLITVRYVSLNKKANALANRTFEAQLDERRRRQASLMNAWMERRIDAQGNTTFEGHYVNESLQPVFECRFSMTVERRGGGPFVTEDHVVPPGQGGDLAYNVGSSPDSDDQPRLTVEFTDAAGNRWRREPEGELNYVGRATAGPRVRA
jgi:hypothetical protein